MPKGVYAAASAMVAETRSLEVTAQNLANAQTDGYRKSVAMRGSFVDLLANNEGRGTAIDQDGGAGIYHQGSYHSFEDGIRAQTGNTYDLALSGATVMRDGQSAKVIPFYRVRDAQGNVFLTRASSFNTDADGRLITADGLYLEGQGGAIQIPTEADKITVDLNGRIYAQTHTDAGPAQSFLDQLRVVTVPRPDLMRARSGRYFDAGEQPQTDADISGYSVQQGYAEHSNVDPIQELVTMIATQRRFDAAQRALKQQVNTGGDFTDILRGS